MEAKAIGQHVVLPLPKLQGIPRGVSSHDGVAKGLDLGVVHEMIEEGMDVRDELAVLTLAEDVAEGDVQPEDDIAVFIKQDGAGVEDVIEFVDRLELGGGGFAGAAKGERDDDTIQAFRVVDRLMGDMQASVRDEAGVIYDPRLVASLPKEFGHLHQGVG